MERVGVSYPKQGEDVGKKGASWGSGSEMVSMLVAALKEQMPTFGGMSNSQPQSEMKEFSQIDYKDSGSVFIVAVMRLVLYAASGIGLIALYAATNSGGIDYQVSVREMDSAGPVVSYVSNYNPTVASAVACLLFALAAFFEIITWGGYTQEKLRDRQSFFAWLGESLGAPILATTIITTFGTTDVWAMTTTFALTHVATILNLVQEMTLTTRRERKSDYGCTTALFNFWLFILIQIPVITYFSYLDNVSNILALTWIAWGLSVLKPVIQGVIQITYARFLCTEKSMYPYEASAPGVANYMTYAALSQTFTLIMNLAIIWSLLGLQFSNNPWLNAATNLVSNYTFTVNGTSVVGKFPAIRVFDRVTGFTRPGLSGHGVFTQ